MLQMNYLVQNGVVEEYVPLMDIKGSYSAQFEHVSRLNQSFGRGNARANAHFRPSSSVRRTRRS